MSLHPLQQQILKIYEENNNNLPSYRELLKTLKVSSLNTIAYHINQLKKNGYFELQNHRSGLVKFNIKNLLNFESKSGVYVLIKNKKPFYVNEAEDIKKDLIKKIESKIINPLTNSSEKISYADTLIQMIKEHSEKIFIAYYLIENSTERKNLKNHLISFYKENGIELIIN